MYMFVVVYVYVYIQIQIYTLCMCMYIYRYRYIRTIVTRYVYICVCHCICIHLHVTHMILKPCIYIYIYMSHTQYGVAAISRLLQSTGLFCRIQSLLQGSFAKETCNFRSTCHTRDTESLYIHLYLHSTHTIPKPSLLSMNLRRVYIYTCVCRGLCTCISTCASTRQRRCIGCLIFTAPFLEKSPIISGSFVERDLQVKAFYASMPLCTCHVTHARLKPSVLHGLLKSIYICVHIYIYICTYIYIYIYIYI